MVNQNDSQNAYFRVCADAKSLLQDILVHLIPSCHKLPNPLWESLTEVVMQDQQDVN